MGRKFFFKSSFLILILVACQAQPIVATDPSVSAPQPTSITGGEIVSMGGGSQIAFSSNRSGTYQIFVMNPDGSQQTQITELPTDNFLPEFYPDGSYLMFIAINSSVDPSTLELIAMRPDGSEQTAIISDPGRGVSFSPDGISYLISGYFEEGNSDIELVTGVSFTRLTTDPAQDFEPDFSPDGQTIAFTSFRNGYSQIFLMDADGSNQRELEIGSMSGSSPDWSPDGTRILFFSGDDNSTQIYVVNVDGTNLIQLTDSQGYNEGPAWSPDGRMIAFWSNRTGNAEIFLMNADGTEQINISNNPAGDENPSWAP